MPHKHSLKNPSLMRHTRDTLVEEFWAWVTLIKSEWKWFLLIALGVAILIVFTKPLPPKNVYLAVGQHGSKFEAIGQKFVPFFAKHGLALHLVSTSGSATSLAELADESNQVSAALLVAGVAQKGQFPNLVSLGSIEYIPLWIFYRGKEFEGHNAYDFFSTKRVALGNSGSASESVLRKTLALTGIELHDRENFLRIPDQEAVQKLIDGEIDAMCIMDGINASNVQKLLSTPNLHILNFPYAQAYVKKLPFFSTVTLPAGSLDLKASHPKHDITMLASTGTLLVDRTMHPVIQQTFLLAASSVSEQDDQFFAGSEFFPRYIDHTIPISPVAEKFYSQGPPGFRDAVPLWLINYVDRIWFLLIGAFAVIYPLFKLFPNYRRKRSVWLIEDAYDSIQEIERRAVDAVTVGELQSLLTQLDDLEMETRESAISSDEVNRLYTMRSAMNLIRQLVLNLKKQREA